MESNNSQWRLAFDLDGFCALWTIFHIEDGAISNIVFKYVYYLPCYWKMEFIMYLKYLGNYVCVIRYSHKGESY